MKPLVVVENTTRWPLEMDEVEVTSARRYLTEPRYAELRRVTVFNLCRHYGYQTLGYYVSLLAEARGHRPLPSVATLRGVREDVLVRMASSELEELIQRSLRTLRTDHFELSVYFGRNVASRYDRLSRTIFNEFPLPLMRARFERSDRWRLVRVRPIPTSEIPDGHRDFVLERARAYFSRPVVRPRVRPTARFDVAILWSSDDPLAPSDERAIHHFERAFHELGIATERVDADDLGRVAEYDALFIRETTGVEHHTYRFARRAAAEGLVVIDDPDSIVRCTNKVFQHELFTRHAIPAPRTLVVHGENVEEVEREIGLPCVLKTPDGSFSQGVSKASTPGELVARLEEMLESSDLVVAQAWTPTAFDWRIGLLGGRPLWAARYHMARGHWQIARQAPQGARYGKVEAVELGTVPEAVVEAATRAAGLIGTGLYGVDVKDVDGRPLVIEVNDNPNIEAGYEDGVLGEELYRAVARWFEKRLEARGSGPPAGGDR